MSAPEIPPQHAADQLAKGEAIVLDVREPHELQRASVTGVLHIPMMQITQRVAEIPTDKPVLVLCHHGGRSQQVADWLVHQGRKDVHNIAGGINAWARLVDPSIGTY